MTEVFDDFNVDLRMHIYGKAVLRDKLEVDGVCRKQSTTIELIQYVANTIRNCGYKTDYAIDVAAFVVNEYRKSCSHK